MQDAKAAFDADPQVGAWWPKDDPAFLTPAADARRLGDGLRFSRSS